MTKFTKQLTSIVEGKSYSEIVLNKALQVADNLEVRVCLQALKSNPTAFTLQGRRVLQNFIVRIDTKTLIK